jgi:predicted nucleic acid-binding protein
MSDRIFVDTNVLVYSIANDRQKRTIAERVLLDNEIVVSPQVINEFVSVTLRKRILPKEQVISYATKFMEVFEVTAMTQQTIVAALDVMTRYQFRIGTALLWLRLWRAAVRIFTRKICRMGRRLKGSLRSTIPLGLHDAQICVRWEKFEMPICSWNHAVR